VVVGITRVSTSEARHAAAAGEIFRIVDQPDPALLGYPHGDVMEDVAVAIEDERPAATKRQHLGLQISELRDAPRHASSACARGSSSAH